jgi:hypothetical protein
MTNNTDIDRMIAFLEKQAFERQAIIDLHTRQLARWAQDPDMTDRLPELEAEHNEQKARLAGINIALQEAKAIKEGY